jgi:putative DNA primase/helicase
MTSALTVSLHNDAQALPKDVSPVHQIAAFLRRFVFLKDDSIYYLIAAWVLCTYMTEIFDYVPYLFFYSPERQCGKSLILEILAALAHNSSGVLISPTEPILFRTASHHTQILDEVDRWRNHESLRGVLNAGFQKTGIVQRLKKNDGGGFEQEQFSVFAPRALGGIGLSILDETTRDRTFVVEMVRQSKKERRDRFRLRRHKGEIAAVRQAIHEWLTQPVRDAIAARYDQEFPYLEDFSDRTIDIAEPLAAITDVADKGVLPLVLDAIPKLRREQREPNQRHRVLARLIMKTKAAGGLLIGNASELLEVMEDGAVDAEFTGHEVSEALRHYGFQTKSIRVDGEAPRYRYSLTSEGLEEIAERYGIVVETQDSV